MTSYQRTILWLGLILVALNIVVHISEVKSVIFGGPSKSSPNEQAGKNAANAVRQGANSLSSTGTQGLPGTTVL